LDFLEINIPHIRLDPKMWRYFLWIWNGSWLLFVHRVDKSIIFVEDWTPAGPIHPISSWLNHLKIDFPLRL
jgi:hypothetical protein